MAPVWLTSLCCALTVFVAVGVKAADWTYDPNDSERGPGNWHKLTDDYEDCENDKQSPIDIDLDNTTPVTPAESRMYFTNYDTYPAHTLNITNTGYTVMVEFPITLQNLRQSPYVQRYEVPVKYRLVNILFHWGSDSSQGSEHAVNGKKFPLEMQLVHYNHFYSSLEDALTKQQGLYVLVFFFELVDADNPGLNTLLKYFSRVKYKGDLKEIAPFNIYKLLGELDNEFVYYDGSYSRPPCTEETQWTIYLKPNTISESQLNKFRQLQKETKENDPNNDQPLVNNFRPLQPRNGRPVYRNNKK